MSSLWRGFEGRRGREGERERERKRQKERNRDLRLGRKALRSNLARVRAVTTDRGLRQPTSTCSGRVLSNRSFSVNQTHTHLHTLTHSHPSLR